MASLASPSMPSAVGVQEQVVRRVDGRIATSSCAGGCNWRTTRRLPARGDESRRSHQAAGCRRSRRDRRRSSARTRRRWRCKPLAAPSRYRTTACPPQAIVCGAAARVFSRRRFRGRHWHWFARCRRMTVLQYTCRRPPGFHSHRPPCRSLRSARRSSWGGRRSGWSRGRSSSARRRKPALRRRREWLPPQPSGRLRPQGGAKAQAGLRRALAGARGRAAAPLGARALARRVGAARRDGAPAAVRHLRAAGRTQLRARLRHTGRTVQAWTAPQVCNPGQVPQLCVPPQPSAMGPHSGSHRRTGQGHAQPPRNLRRRPDPHRPRRRRAHERPASPASASPASKPACVVIAPQSTVRVLRNGITQMGTARRPRVPTQSQVNRQRSVAGPQATSGKQQQQQQRASSGHVGSSAESGATRRCEVKATKKTKTKQAIGPLDRSALADGGLLERDRRDPSPCRPCRWGAGPVASTRGSSGVGRPNRYAHLAVKAHCPACHHRPARARRAWAARRTSVRISQWSRPPRCWAAARNWVRPLHDLDP
jgi:hypothetical protein